MNNGIFSILNCILLFPYIHGLIVLFFYEMHFHTFISLLTSCHICTDLSEIFVCHEVLCSLFMLQNFPSLLPVFWLCLWCFWCWSFKFLYIQICPFFSTSRLHILFRKSFSELICFCYFPTLTHSETLIS